MPKRRRQYFYMRVAAIVCAIIAFALLAGLPLLEMYLESVGVVLHDWPGYGLLQRLQTLAMELLVVVWFFAFGSMVGSFANVVVYRMPLGVSVVAKPSACPYCASKIRLADNIPIFGWLKLGGRCRNCRLPISPRYPIVEFVFGSVFLLLFAVELHSGGANVPGWSATVTRSGILSTFVNPPWSLIALYAFHCALMSMLLIWALMEYDRNRLPTKTIVFVLLVGAIAPVIWPYLQPVKWVDQHENWFREVAWLRRMDTGFLGLAGGYLLGGVIDQIFADSAVRDVAKPPNHIALGLMAVGLFMGWQAVMTTALMFALGNVFAGLIARRLPRSRLTRFGPGFWLAGAALLQICIWKFINNSYPVTEFANAAVEYLVCGLLAIGILWLSQRLIQKDVEHDHAGI